MPRKTILIAEDDLGLLRALKLRCQQLDTFVRTASDGLKALKLVREITPDLLILDINMPAADGLSVCEELMNDPTYSPLPVIFFSGRSDPETLRRCRSLGAHFVFKDADIWAKLKPLITKSLQDQHLPTRPSTPSPQPSSSPKALVVDGDLQIVHALRNRLLARGVEVLTASNGMQAFWKAVKSNPDVIISDYGTANGDGVSLLSSLKVHSFLKSVPVIVITGKTKGGQQDRDRMCNMLQERGAVASFTKPLDFEALFDELRRHVRLDAVRPGSRGEPYGTKTPS